MADPHFMYHQQHADLNPKQERKKLSARAWAKRLSGVLLLFGAVGLTAYSLAGGETPTGAIAINAVQTQKGAVVVAATNNGNVWVNQVVCKEKLSSEDCNPSGWINLGGDMRNPSIALRAGSDNLFHIVALGKDEKAYYTDVECVERCAVQGGRATPDAWQAVAGQTKTWSQVVAYTPLSPPAGANCEATLFLEKEGDARVYSAATCSDGSNSGEAQPVVERRRNDTINEESEATKAIVSLYTSDSFSRDVYLQNSDGLVSQLSDFGYNDQPYIHANSVVDTESLKQSSHSFIMHGSPSIGRLKTYGVQPSGDVAVFTVDAEGETESKRTYTNLSGQKEIHTGLEGYVVKNDNNQFLFIYPKAANANATGSSVNLGGNYPIAHVVDAKIFAIDDAGTVLYRTYAPQQDAAGTVSGINEAKSQVWKAL